MSLDCEGQGAVCVFDGCGVFDFLPTTCSRCSGVFCSAHCDANSHVCVTTSSMELSQQYSGGGRREFLECATCHVADIFVAMCTICSKAMCVAHRFEHQHIAADAAARVVDRVAAAAPSAAERKVRLGPLPVGARGQECLIVMCSSRQCASSQVDGMRWCRAIVGLGGSAGKICEDVVKSVAGTPLASSSCRAFAISCRGAGPSCVADDVTALMTLQPIANHELAQDFMRTDSPEGFFALLFVLGDVLGASCDAGSATVEVDHSLESLLHQRLVGHMRDDMELMRRFRWFVLTACRRQPATVVADQSAIVVDAPPSVDRNEQQEQGAPTIDSPQQVPLVTNAAILRSDPSALRFATTKSAPRGSSAVKGAAKWYVAVLVAHRGALRDPQLDGFVLVVDPKWPNGKLLDRVLEEAADLGCPRDPVAYDKRNLAQEGSATVRREGRVWGLVHLPSMRWVCNQGNNATMSAPCGTLVDDKSAIVLVTAPPEESASRPLVLHTDDEGPPLSAADNARKLKLLQMKECSVM